MLSCRTWSPCRLCPQPVHTLWPVPLAAFEPLECTAWKRAEATRKVTGFVERIFEELVKEFRGEGAREQRQRAAAAGEGDSGQVGEDGDGFSLWLDVLRFSPEELKVKVLGRKVLVTGSREKKSDDGSGSSSYKYEELRREFQLPDGVDAQAVNCCLSQDGRLQVRAPRLALPAVDERLVPINVESGEATGPVPNPGEEAKQEERGEVGGNKETHTDT
ncbi:heat shock protein beta-11-like [Narcine bancroftii]